ncbi:MAG: chorismate-binding protein, partial [Bacteroidales bacterium]|nr:chorismate-binding protein [Bacteroidales bacterium]
METFKYTTISRSILADLHTPVGVYMKLRDLYLQSALMESSDYHDSNNSRSFIGIHPIASVAISPGESISTFPDGSVTRHAINREYRCDNAINDFLKRFEVTGAEADYCGLYGYTTFNAVRYFENIAVKDVTLEKNDAPDMYYIFYRDIIVFDHFNNKMTVITLEKDDDKSLSTGKKQLDELFVNINKGNVKPYGFHPVGEVTSTLTDEEHKANIRKGIQHCLRGDVFQIVLSRRFVQKYEGDDFKLYRALRSINPSPYLFYFDFGGFRIFGSSPETHCRIEKIKSGTVAANGKTVATKEMYRAYIDPIAGTTKRTG